jgi:hypothetical protein
VEYTLGVGAFVVFAVSLAAYASTVAPTAGWLDSAEFVAASVSLGVSHSPGHPIPLLLGRAACLLPIGDLAFRVNLSSALAMAVATSLLYGLCRMLLSSLAAEVPARVRGLVAAASALGFAFSFSAWFQAVRAEVYALEVALLLGTLLGVVRFLLGPQDRRPLYAAGLACGLALANHHFLTLLVFVPAAALVLRARPPLGSAATTALFGVLGLAAFLYLPVRASVGPEVNWGDPDRWGRFVWTVSAQAFHKSLSPVTEGERPHALADVLGVLGEQATPLVVLASLLGAYLLLRQAGPRRLGALFVLVFTVGVAGHVVLGFDPDNPDAHGYLLPLLAVMFVLAGVGFVLLAARLVDARPSWRRLVLGLLTLVAWLPVPLQLAVSSHSASLRGAEAPAYVVDSMLERLPPRALLVTSYYETLFQLWAARAVDHARPDVVHLDRSLLTYPGAREEACARHPELKALVEAPLSTGASAPLALLSAEATRRRVAFELHFTLEEALQAHLVPAGLVAFLVPDSPSDAARTASEQHDADAIAKLAAALSPSPPRDRAGAKNLLVWNAYLRARLYCGLGRFAAGRVAAQIVATYSPGDAVLGELDTLCTPP